MANEKPFVLDEYNVKFSSAYRARVGEEGHGPAAVDVGLEGGVRAWSEFVLQVAHHHLAGPDEVRLIRESM